MRERVCRRARRRRVGLYCLLLAALAVGLATGSRAPVAHAQADAYDVVLRGGRVIDPETGLDAVRNVGVRDDRIVEITEAPLQGRDVVDVSGLVVAPGFIDLHAHGQTNQANEFQAHDGVTTALELESGQPFVDAWLASRMGHALIHFGATIGHSGVRWRAMEKYAAQAVEVKRIVGDEGLESEALGAVARATANARYEALTAAELVVMRDGLVRGLADGALGIGVPVGYYPAATREEIFRVYEFAAEYDAPVFTHVREGALAAIQEAIADAAVTGAPLHVVHLNSMALGDIGVALEMVASAQRQGLDITTEVYPYTAASTGLASVLFDPGWQERLGISYDDLQWVATNERLTAETFAAYREEGGTVIIHLMKPEWIEQGVRSPVTMIGSDGMPYAPGAHPRSAGTFARVLGRYVREAGVLTLRDALAKITLRPAQRLEGIAPAMRLKGRLQVGCDADIAVFDPETIIDTATFEADLSFSEGVHHVLVGGTFVVKNGETVTGVYPGRPVLGRYRR